MRRKAKAKQNPHASGKPQPAAQAPPGRLSGAAPRPPADARWQRTVRYGWDKGGAKGGR